MTTVSVRQHADRIIARLRKEHEVRMGDDGISGRA